MHKLLVLYNEPKDPAHFRKYYVETHLPLASKIPGVKATRYAFDVKPLGPGKAPYFCVFEAEFENEAALMSGLASKEGQAVAGYGASTAGANRFMPPRKPEPWTGVRDATVYAGRSPQARAGAQRPELATLWGVRDSLPVGEDCLTLNVWTPALDTAKRPVMVWLHGGAFSYGSANSAWYDGGSLARRNDVVVVSVNHRLNIFGHLDLSASGDERFAQSGNAGVLDLVAALQWVREHAARFGGDPGNVTIFGQSGGGGKVSALLAMPGAKGLFHKAIIQSGAGVRFAERERTTRLADAVLKQLELGPPAIGSPAGAADRTPDGSHRPGAEDPAAAALCAARPLQFRTGDRRAGAAGPSLRSGRLGPAGRRPGHDRRDQGRVRRSSWRPTTPCGTARSARTSCASASPRSPAMPPTACWRITSGAMPPRRRPIS